jgi:hypothetical protein
MPKYIFVTGAPGSKWSSVVKNIYYGADIDRGDYSEDRTYYHSATGTKELMHIGAYWDPGMEFGGWFDQLDQNTKEACESEFDRPWTFSQSSGIRIIKSHVFSTQIDFLRENWPDCPVVLVHRSNDACLGWWVRCGEFGITYPRYDWYKNLEEMAWNIDYQNNSILNAAAAHDVDFDVVDNWHLCQRLGITPPPAHHQSYPRSDIKVAVLR